MRYTAPRSSNSSSGSGSSKGTSKASVKASSKNSIYTAPKKEPSNAKVKEVYRSEDMLAASSDNVRLLEGPGNEYEVIEVLKKYAVLKVIAVDGEWLQVVVIESKNFGYVNAKLVYKI
ncbi:SH3 domain-containing protein [Flavobacterium notoginsengisoli]|uniref:SH3 domain-containing protein n=1 Tax=Flavobacterium notoginsengisoli TaxID=1478199 RepID=UPI00364391D9